MVGAVLGLVTHNARLVLLEGSVPTVVIVYNTSTSTALSLSKVTPYIWIAATPTPAGAAAEQ